MDRAKGIFGEVDASYGYLGSDEGLMAICRVFHFGTLGLCPKFVHMSKTDEITQCKRRSGKANSM